MNTSNPSLCTFLLNPKIWQSYSMICSIYHHTLAVEPACNSDCQGYSDLLFRTSVHLLTQHMHCHASQFTLPSFLRATINPLKRNAVEFSTRWSKSRKASRQFSVRPSVFLYQLGSHEQIVVKFDTGHIYENLSRKFKFGWNGSNT
jgi:hypothetical protein